MKKWIPIVLAMVLLMGAMSLSVGAASLADQTPGQAAKAMTFPTDGSNHVAICPVCGKSVTWYALNAATVSAGKTLSKNYHYYLSEDVDATRDGPLISAAGSTGARCCLHLNGKKLINRGNVALQGSVSRFNVMGDGVVQGSRTGATEGATIQINPGMAYGAVVLYGGTYSKVDPATTANVAAARGNGGVIELHDGATIQAGTAGSAVYLNGEMTFVSASFKMYGGTLDASATSELAVDMEEDDVKKANKVEFHIAGGTLIGGAAGAVTVRDTTAVYMTGGTIQNGHITIEANGKMELSGGTITGGTATNGGNIYIAPGAKLTMTGGTVKNGTATNGGNVYVDQNAVFTMSGGKVENGTASGNGGNVYVGYSGTTIEETPPVFTMTGGSLENGTATKEGGNLYAVGLNAAAKNAMVNLKNATISGGTATSNGGNITLNRSTMTMDGDTKILNGTSTGARAGNIRLYIGKLIMNDGLIGGGSAKTGATDNIWAYGVSNTYPGSVYMLGGVIDPATDRHNAGVSLAAYGRLYLANNATFTNEDPQCAAVCVGSSNSNYGKLFICDGWTGFADAYVLDKGYAVGAEVSNSYIQIVKLKSDLTTTVGGSFTGTLTQLYEGTGQFIPGAASGKLTVANSVLVTQDGKLTATADPLTDWAAGEHAYLKLSSDLTIEDLGGKELCVDLNGHDLAVGGSGNVKAFDSQNDAYNALVCGEITVTGDVTVEKETFAPNGNHYVALTENGKITMRRLEMQLTAVTLRTSAAGLYYKATYKCDKVLEKAVTKYGVVLSVFNMPGADFVTETKDINQYTVGTEAFKSGIVTTSGSVFGILEDGRSAANNSQRGQIKIYANPYVTVGEQTVMGDSKNAGKTANDEGFDGVAYSLQDAMNTVDHIFYDYNLTDRDQFSSFYETWKNKGMDWHFDNIGDRYAVDNSALQLSSGKAYCPVCKKTVTWTAITQAAYGTAPLGALSNGNHYYLAEDITYTGADATFVRAPGTGSSACLHLNGFDLVATNHVAITGYAGTLNVMGNGTVMGYTTTENSGAAVTINTSGANGKINLYGGTYTLPQTNETAAAVSVFDNGGEINLYEGVTVRGAGGYSVYMGEANLRSAKLGIYGAKIEGVVNCAEPSDSTARSCTLEIGGNAEIDEVKTRSMYVTDRLSGAPKIGLMSMVANVAMELDGLSEGAAITVNTRGTLTAASDRIDQYKKYFTPYVPTDSLTVVDNALRYDINYEQYMTPFIRDVSAEAIADSKIHYYFMSSEGMVTSPTAADNIYKWGDSCLIVFPNGETMLVDTGYSMQQPWLIGNLKRMGIGSEENPLDYLLITHPHSDHQGAFYSPYPFFDEIKVTQVYHNKLVVNSATTDDYVENACAALNLPLMDLKRGEELDFGAVHMEVLWPTADMSTTAISSGKINDTSMVFRLDYGEHSALFTADLYVKGEGDLMAIEDPEKLDVDFLKIPHHGWNTSSSEDFVNAVSPEIAVATSFLEMEEQIRRRYVATKTTVLLDVYNGYIHVSAGNDGVMTYETSR